jgi:hypothetical protein
MTARWSMLALAVLALACGDDLPDEEGPGAEDTVACLPAEVVTALERHALDLAATAELLAGHPSAHEVTGFVLAPALPFPPALSAAFAGPLVVPCTETRAYEPFCEEGRCSRIACTGRGAGWVHHLWIDRPVATGRWYIEAVDVIVSWEDAAVGTEFAITTNAKGPGAIDVSMLSAGTMDERGMSVLARFPALHAAGETTLDYAFLDHASLDADDPSGYRGRLSIGELVVAEVDASARLVPTGDCP